jgi:hypothetical protein
MVAFTFDSESPEGSACADRCAWRLRLAVSGSPLSIICRRTPLLGMPSAAGWLVRDRPMARQRRLFRT